MNDKEKTEFYIAMCKCCTLAQAMKACPVCRFNIGLAEELIPADSTPLTVPAQITIFAMSE